MKQIRILTQMFVAFSILLVMNACYSEDFSENDTSRKHTVKMKLQGDVVGFDHQNSDKVRAQTRTINSSWKDGDKIYITFYNGSDMVPGEATYSSASGWSVSYDGNLVSDGNQKCEARYFVNATFSSSSLVSLNSNTQIYEDLNATYTYSNGSLTVTATLSPKTGRIRFTGKSGEKIYTTGITVYTTFAPAINTFSTSNAMITSTVASNGSTPYIYGYFTDSDRNLGLVGSDYAFTRTCTSNMFNVGESGYMAIPSETSHNNWRSGLYVKASGVDFKMIPVVGFSGGFFLMAETETTEALYKSVVTGVVPASQLPVDNISYLSILSFIEKLNNETKLNFSLPTSGQWKYAAIGGNKSQDYTYAGSNTPGDVAWYSANCSSKQKVKTKAPNELGIYDMSGNVGEITSTNKGGFHDIYGGGYPSSVGFIDVVAAVNYYYYNYSGGWAPSYAGFNNHSDCLSKGVGFRLVLVCK